ncbi:MAG: phosphoribosylaminoimidazolesuccinocarboxamide synthase [Halobacteria archaeon]|nr:phosphoribosylaminoimidazolesuccinocarboxamide synthase [Halobacteria archaeon]
MTSVKNFSIYEEATSEELGRGEFVFTDDYSVFDWGKMPDKIESKGRSLCTMGAYNFELLEDEGIETHYIGVGEDAVRLEEADEAPERMSIRLTQVPDLEFDEETGEYDYESFHDEGGDSYLIPLEIVFRNSVPIGSSLRSRKEPSDFGLDYDDWPDEHVDLDSPIVEFSTKFEDKDRYLDEDEASEISGKAEIDELRETAREVNRVVTEKADEVGLSHEDGKIECLYYDGDILVADVVGTFDENRFLYDGEQISKEFLRGFYKGYDPDWVSAVEDAKKEADERGVADWKSLCEVDPKPLPDDVAATASELYTSGANLYTGRDWFDAPELAEVVEKMRRQTS